MGVIFVFSVCIHVCIFGGDEIECYLSIQGMYGYNGVLRKLKHIFPNTYQRINSICSPAKVGLVVIDFNYQPSS